MGAAAYVGRVGGLAVALGVGSAIVTGHGVAWADDTESAVSKPSISASSNDTTTPAESTDKPEKTASDPDDEVDTDLDPDDSVEPALDSDDEVQPGGEVPEDETEPDDQVDTDDEVEADDEVEPELDPEPAGAVGHSGGKPAKAAETATVETPTTQRTETEVETTAKSTTAKTTGKTRNSSDTNSDGPAAVPQQPQTVVNLATVGSSAGSKTPTSATTALVPGQQDELTKKPTLITAVVNVVNSMLDWARQKADAQPGDAPQPPFLWALMAFARRELDTLFTARSTTNAPRSSAVTPTSLTLTESATTAALVPSYSPWLNPQVSPSTNFVSWVTGSKVYGDKLLANTLGRYQVYGTDVGVMWDNGMVDDPNTPYNEHQVLIAVGDTFGSPNMTGRWIYNTLFRSSDTDLSDGMQIPNGQWYTGNMFGGAPLSGATQARPIINRPSWAPNSVTLIPTAGVSLPTAVTEDTPFGTIQYVNFMSVSKWGQSGRWTTNYSATAYSYDNGENFTVAPQSVRYNSFFGGNKNFQQSAYVKGDDGYVYVYGTPNGRQGAAYLARVADKDILDVSKYQYYKKASSGWFGTKEAKWVTGSPSSASAIIGKTGGFFGFTKPGYTVSELSVQYNEYLKKYIVLYGDQSNNIVMRTADTPEGTWSDAKVLMGQQSGGIYAPMLHPWSPATQGTGSDLYWNLSLWSEYNVMLMHTDLSKL